MLRRARLLAARAPADAIPRLLPGARARIARRAGLWFVLVTLIVLALAGALAAGGRPEVAGALLVGHAVAHAATASWLFGALYAFDRSLVVLLALTLGATPARIALAVAAVIVAVDLGHDPLPLLLAFLATALAGHVLEHLTLDALIRAQVPRAKPPADG